ncbi:uncharacterized mitochondrial protein-like protein [Tanacetum coccineum]
MAKVANGGVDDDDDDDVVDLYEGNGGAAMVLVVKEMVNEMEMGSGGEDSSGCRRNFAGKIRRKSFPTAGNPTTDLKDKGVIDSGCSRRMGRKNKSYLLNYEEWMGGFVTFGRKDNMYSVDLNNVVPQGCLTYLFAKAIPDESNLWHRRLRHVNFKTMNKLVRGNLVRGLLLKVLILSNMLLLCQKESITHELLGKFDGKADEGFFVGFVTNSKAFRVFNSRTRIVEENLHVQFSENTPNIAGSGPNWLFDIDALTKSMNYKPVVAGNQSNSNASIKACNDAGKARMETVPGKDYILLPMWPADPLFSQDLKSSPDAGFKPSREEEKKDAEDPKNKDSEVPSTEEPREDWYQRVNQVLDAGINSTNNINTASDGNSTNNVNVVSSTVNVAGIEVNVVDPKTSIELPSDPTMPELEDIVYSDDDEDMDVKSVFLYGKIEEEVYVCQPSGFEDPDFPDRVYKVEKALYGLNHTSRACTPMETQKPLLKDEDGEEVDVHLYRSMIGSLMYRTSSKPDIMFSVCACARYQVNLKVSHLHAVKRIFRYLKGQPKLGLWYPKDSPFDLVAYTDSDYVGASLDKKSTTGGCQFLGCRLISWQCKKQIVVTNSTTEAEYVVDLS